MELSFITSFLAYFLISLGAISLGAAIFFISMLLKFRDAQNTLLPIVLTLSFSLFLFVIPFPVTHNIDIIKIDEVITSVNSDTSQITVIYKTADDKIETLELTTVKDVRNYLNNNIAFIYETVRNPITNITPTGVFKPVFMPIELRDTLDYYKWSNK